MRVLFGCLSLILLNACSQGPFGMNWGEESISSDTASSMMNQYSADATAILQAKCASCHAPPACQPKGPCHIMDIGNDVALGFIVPGSPNSSSIYTVLPTNYMPNNGSTLTDAEKATIFNWIAAGNSGS